MKLRAILGYTAAGMTVLAALLVPFLLMGAIPMGAYSINIHRPVYPHFLQSGNPFVQLDWTPVNALPQHVSDVVDVDGDGRPDLRVSFDVPKDAKAPLHVDVEPINPRYLPMRNVGKEGFSRLIVRVDNSILVRVPLANR